MVSPKPYKCSLKYFWIGLKHIVTSTEEAKIAGLDSKPNRAPPAAYAAPFLVVASIALLASHFGRQAMGGLKYYGSVPLAVSAVVLAVVLAMSLPVMLVYRGWRAIQRTCKLGWEADLQSH